MNLSDEAMFGGFGTGNAYVRKRQVINPYIPDEAPATKHLKVADPEEKQASSEMKAEESSASGTATPHTKDDTEENIKEITKIEKGFADLGTLETSQHNKECLHEVALPTDVTSDDIYLFNPQMPKVLAKEYPFELDPFQSSAVACIERDESVLVSAHTSAGKTAVAEYAIAKGLQANSRVLYTSPIKALSNQKYRELHETFKDVGLITGDVTINPEASCIVMTTEILRSMLYRGSEILREVHWVVFDEVHYIRDKERGVVWEETLILLPDETRFVFLSATIPNAREFAQWIADLHKQPCHVVYTEFRPVPLQHYLFPSGGEGVFLVVDEKSTFREKNYQKAIATLSDPVADDKTKKKRRVRTSGKDIYRIVKMLMERKYDPAIVFSFSKRECERLAVEMGKLDLNNLEEKELVDEIFNNAIDDLSDEDRKLPAIRQIFPLLQRGIGIHHGGLLPVIKEVVEILFQEGLIKTLFATETFAMGLNMPARTVLFTDIRKFDGISFRPLTSGEYIQMSGRAGRRGKDTRGIVILMLNEKLEPRVGKELLMGKADPLNSEFYLSYNMLLNLIRSEHIQKETMLLESFHQFQNDSQVPEIKRAISIMTKERDEIEIAPDLEEDLGSYYRVSVLLSSLKSLANKIINQPKYVLPFLQPGRVVRISEDEIEWGEGIVINFRKETVLQDTEYYVDTLLPCKKVEQDGGSVITGFAPARAQSDQSVNYHIVPFPLKLIDGVSAVRLYMPRDMDKGESKKKVGKLLAEAVARFPKGLPMLDPIEDMKIREKELAGLREKNAKLERKLDELKAVVDANSDEYQKYCQKEALAKNINAEKKRYRESKSLVLQEELHCMMRVLRRLGHVNSENIIEMKGRVASEVNAADELVITELIFNGVFNELTVNQIVALLSCFLFEEKSNETPTTNPALQEPYRLLQDSAKKVAKISRECKVTIDEQKYLESFRPEIMEVVYEWSRGAKFREIIEMTSVFEGSIIRTMHRLEELLRQLCDAAKAIGNTELEIKFADGISSLKRDIVFCPSLYI